MSSKLFTGDAAGTPFHRGLIMKSIAVTSLAVAVLMTALAPVAAQEKTVAVFTKNQTNPWFQSFRNGADQAAKQFGVTVTHFVPERADNIQDQISQVENAITKKYSAFVVDPVDYKALVPAIQRANAAGIPLINFSDRLEGGDYKSFVGVPDYQVGVETANYLIEALGGKGKIVILEGVKGSITSQDRNRGFQDVLAQHPDIVILDSQPANYQRLMALQVMENLLQSHAEIDGILATNDAMAIGAIEALQGAARTAKVIGINGTAEAVDAIKAGTLLASTNSNPYLQGCVSTLLAARVINGESVIPEYAPALTIIDASNADAASVPDAERTCPTWEEISK
jgi:ribose transport system substrate-binding protein